MNRKIYTFPILCESSLSIRETKARNNQKSQEQSGYMKEEDDILIFDTGGGRNGTTTRIVWHVFEYKNHKQRLLGYQDKVRERCTLLLML